ncbi:MAG TPA: YdeI/OmpD-associated family protein [Vineibacter sp.]|nr:YdeI/OmpD-associated family protein [Vineibacter sp.]
MPKTKDGLPILAFASAADWEAWLEAQPMTSSGLWLKLAKKEAGIDSVSQPEAVEGALCFGWIDGQGQSLDARYWLQRFTPRKARSKWSQKNRTKALALIKQGRMRPSGLAEVERAKADGRWDAAYPSPSKATVPDDLQRALDRVPKARRMFETLDGANRYAILHRVHDAKKAETRAGRIEKYVAMLARGETIHPPRRPRAKE